MGPYFFTTLVNLLGPAKNIRGRGVKFSDKREYKAGPNKGKFFDVEIPTSYMFNLEFVNETIIQGFISFDVQIMEETTWSYMELMDQLSFQIQICLEDLSQKELDQFGKT